MLYRVLLAVQLWVAVSTAPQDGGTSDVTIVQVKPIPDPGSPEIKLQEESSENIPIISGRDVTDSDSSIEKGEFVEQVEIPAVGSTRHNRSEQDLGSEDRTDTTTDIEPSGSELEETVVSDDESDSSAEESARTRYEYTTVADFSDTTETTEALTETIEVEEIRPKFASPRSLSKFEVKKKSNSYGFSANLIEKSEKRKFRSTCKCMRIWNCPKLQISVGRCSEELFLCCV